MAIRKGLTLACLFALAPVSVQAHGNLNYPPSTRQGIAGKIRPGSYKEGGYCEQPWGPEKQKFQHNNLNGACMLFSQPNVKQPTAAVIPGPPTNNVSKYRTVNVNVSSGPGDWTRIMPWRAPGSAPVLGSGCGVAGGGDVWNGNGGWPSTDMAQGADALLLPQGPPTIWKAGSVVEVAWGMWANHGGGYSYRICRNIPGTVTEACFQQTPLKFAGDKQWLQHINGTRVEIPIVMLSEGTYPEGSQWARVPFPECASKPCFDAPSVCAAHHGMGDVCDDLAYPEPIPNTHGFGHDGAHGPHTQDFFHDYSMVDKVILPKDLPSGDYLLSWRWDCEQTNQIWQNCADIRITTDVLV